MSWPTKEDLDWLLNAASNPPSDTPILLRSDWLVYLIENLRRANAEVLELADRVDDLHESYNKQLRRAKKWKRRYIALEKKSHEVRQGPHDSGGPDGAGA